MVNLWRCGWPQRCGGINEFNQIPVLPVMLCIGLCAVSDKELEIKLPIDNVWCVVCGRRRRKPTLSSSKTFFACVFALKCDSWFFVIA